MYKEFIIDQIVQESTIIKSFYLRRADDRPLDSYLPGQFVTLRVRPDNTTQEYSRNYTLSDCPGKEYFRLTIKREEQGIVSKYMHDVLQAGDQIDLSKPHGDFHLSINHSRPAVLISGGVGITPMLSMLEYITAYEPDRRVLFIHASRNKAVQPMLARLRELTVMYKNLYLSVHHSEPTSDEREFIDYDFTGFISRTYLASVLPEVEMDYYLCGPLGFMETMYQYLRELGVDEKSIRYEFFGKGKRLSVSATKADSNSGSFTVKFNQSDVEIDWNDTQPSLLDLAESVGLTPAFSCRMGTCSSCESILQKGAVKYDPEPFVEAPAGKVLICCSQPVSDVVLEL